MRRERSSRDPFSMADVIILLSDTKAMIIGAMGDAHGRKYINLVNDMKKAMSNVQLLLLAGDIAEANNLDEYQYSLSKIREATEAPIVAVFGNDEWEQSRDEYRRRFDVTFLDDQETVLQIDNLKVKVVGTTGSLDRPTWWQRTNIPNVWNKYRERINKVSSLLDRGDADVLILLMHYAPTYLTLSGEREKAFPEMGSKQFEPVILKKSPDLVVHSHAHDGKKMAILRRPQKSLENFGAPTRDVLICNVSLPLTHTVVRWEITHEKDGVRTRLLE